MSTTNFFKTLFTQYYFVREEANKFDIEKVDISKLQKKYKSINFDIYEEGESTYCRNRPFFRKYSVAISKKIGEEECYIKFYYGYRAGHYSGVNFDIEIEDVSGCCERAEEITDFLELQEAISKYGKSGNKIFLKATSDLLKLLNDAGKEFAENTLIQTARFSNGEAMYKDIQKPIA